MPHSIYLLASNYSESYSGRLRSRLSAASNASAGDREVLRPLAHRASGILAATRIAAMLSTKR